MALVVVVEDEPAIADAVLSRLRSDGFEAHAVGDGLAAVELCRRLRPDLVVLDLALPGIDGLEVCRRIQAERRVPVVMLTARDDETDLVVGLSVGADDYVTKPFSPRELVARIRAVLRRAEAAAEGVVLRHAGVELDHATRRVRRDGAAVHLTPIELDLLAHLLGRPGVVFPRERLLVEVWGYADGTGPRTVDSHVRSLRRKLGDDTVRTVHGVPARRMAAGDREQRVTATSADEVGELARAFNDMAADLAAVDRMRSDLIANVAHELRTPLAAIRAQLENLVDGVVEPHPDVLAPMLDHTERLGRLVAQLLDLSRLESGTWPSTSRPSTWPPCSRPSPPRPAPLTPTAWSRPRSPPPVWWWRGTPTASTRSWPTSPPTPCTTARPDTPSSSAPASTRTGPGRASCPR